MVLTALKSSLVSHLTSSMVRQCVWVPEAAVQVFRASGDAVVDRLRRSLLPLFSAPACGSELEFHTQRDAGSHRARGPGSERNLRLLQSILRAEPAHQKSRPRLAYSILRKSTPESARAVSQSNFQSHASSPRPTVAQAVDKFLWCDFPSSNVSSGVSLAFNRIVSYETSLFTHQS